MRWILTVLFAIVTLAIPSLLPAQTVPYGYRLQCNNGVCRLVRIQPTYPAVQYAVPSQGVQYAPQITQPTNFVRTVSFVSDDASVNAPTNAVAAPYAVPMAQTYRMGAGNCGCVTSGVCVCAPGTCTCVGCPGNINGNMGFAPTVQYATGNSYYSVAQPTVMGYAPGFVGTTYDGFGNAYVTAAGVSRRVARHIRKGARLGINYSN